MELMVDVKVRPKIIPITNNIYKRFGTYLTVDELNQYAQKFMKINRDKFVCDILNNMDFTRKGQIIVAEAFDRKSVDVSSAKFTVFQHFWKIMNYISFLGFHFMQMIILWCYEKIT